MDTELSMFNVDKFDTETILSKKPRVHHPDPVLCANLDYAARVFANMSPTYSSGAMLSVMGTCTVVRFIQNFIHDAEYGSIEPDGAIRFSVTSEDGRPRLIRNVTCHNIIKASDIKEAHFAGHNCQDQVQSCFHQVRAAVPQVKGCRNVCIVCNGLSLTYGENTTDGCYTLKTRCRLVFKHRTTLRELLEMKCWLEQEKPHKKGLLACFDRLLNQVTELHYVPIQCTFILQSDGEMVELLESSGQTGREFLIFGGANGVSVYPPQWE